MLIVGQDGRGIKRRPGLEIGPKITLSQLCFPAVRRNHAVWLIDDWGLAVLTAPERRDLLEILEDRHGRTSTIVTSQLPVEYWHEAILDKAKDFVTNLVLGMCITDIHALSASKIAGLILTEARELGIPEGEVHGVPADLTIFPDWFVKTELARRDLLNNWNNPEFGKKL